MIDRIGHLVSDVGGSLELLRSKLMQGQITPQEAELARIRIERLKEAKAMPVEGGTVVDKGIQQLMARGQQPSAPQQMPVQEEVAMAYGGLAELPVNMFDESNYAGGGIVAFSNGDLVEDEDEYKGIDYDKVFEKYIAKGLPKSPVSKYFQYDVPRPETGYLKKRMERAKGEGLTALDVKGLGDREREAYGIKDIFGPRMEEIKGFKDQAEKSRDYALGAAGLQAAAALLSKPTLGLAAEEASKTSIPTLLAGQREYVKDVRDASKLAFEAGAAQQAYNMDLFRGDTARADKNRTRYETAVDKLAAYDEGFLNDIRDRTKNAAESAAMWQIKTDAARADNTGKNMFGTLNSAIYNGINAITNREGKINSMFPPDTMKTVNMNLSKFGVVDSKGQITPKPGLTDDQMKIFNQNYAIYDDYNRERSMLESMRKSHAKLTEIVSLQAGIPPGTLDIYGTNQSAPMANPSKSTIKGDVDYNNKFLRNTK